MVALVLSLGVANAFADDPVTGSISITPPDNVAADANNSYSIYKVFDAVGDGNGHISYTVMASKNGTVPDCFSVDTAGNVSYSGTSNNGELTSGDIEKIAAYIAGDDPVATATSVGEAVATATGLANGYYYIATSTGSVVMINSTNPNWEIKDKNTVPTINKKITNANQMSEDGKKAIAAVGTDVEYTATVTVGKGSKNLVFHDKMDSRLTFKQVESVTSNANPALAEGWYTQKATPDGEDTITITFVDGIPEGTVITIKYLATINASALTVVQNDAWVTYGDGYTTEHDHADVYNMNLDVLKFDGEKKDNKPLAGAGFKLKNSEGLYYKWSDTAVAAVEATEDTPAQPALVKGINWVASEADGDEHTSGADGKVPAFVGLAPGNYTLVETTVPKGFNKAADTAVVIAEVDFDALTLELTKTVDVENFAGSVLPSTGGIGTTIFYVVGGVLVLAAIILLVTKKRMSD